MLISKSEYCITNADVLSYGRDHGFTVPQEYTDFLLKYNGGKTPKTNFKLSGISSDISCFYGLRDGRTGLELYNIEFRVKEFLRDKMLPIAENVFGDIMFICVDGQESGKIFFRYHDRSKRYILLADTFKAFIQKCNSKKLEHCYTIEERIAMRERAGNFNPPSMIALTEWQKEIDYYRHIHQEKVEL